MQNVDSLVVKLSKIRKKYENQSDSEIEETLLEKGKEVMSIVTEALYLKFGGQRPVVSGGFSVEYYTEGKHTTEDIDIIINKNISNLELHEIFETLGFEKKSNRSWSLDDIGIFIEKVGDEIFGGEHLEIVVDDIFSISFVNVNDIVIDRIKGLTHWDRKNYGNQLIDLISFNEKEIDNEYIESKLIGKELEKWQDIKAIFKEEESLESYTYRLVSLLEEKDIIYSELLSENHDKIYILFPVVYNQKTVYLGIDIIEKCQEIMYDADEERVVVKKWPDYLTRVWNQYYEVLDILNEVNP